MIIDLDQNVVNEAFAKFIDTPIPAEAANYEFKSVQVLLRVFDYQPDTTNELISDEDSSKSMYYMTFPVAKVLAVGPDSDYNVGDIVKLHDHSARTIPNPKYEAWGNNPMSEGNMERVGAEPPRLMNNLFVTFMKNIFAMSPISVNPEDDMFITLLVTDQHIACKIKDPHALISA